MFVLGVDPGLTRTGYGIIDSSGEFDRAITAGVISTDPALTVAERLVELRSDFSSLLSDYKIEAAAIEQIFVKRNRNTAMSVARASGVIMELISSEGVEVHEYTPSQVKLATTGNGSADKQQMRDVVCMRLGVKGIDGPADVSDALGVAICHAQNMMIRTVEAAL